MTPSGEDRVTLWLTVNGETTELRVPARKLLSDVLREDLGLTGTHVGCEHGVCGACTVLIDGAPARACLTFAIADGRPRDHHHRGGRAGRGTLQRAAAGACMRSTPCNAASARRAS